MKKHESRPHMVAKAARVESQDVKLAWWGVLLLLAGTFLLCARAHAESDKDAAKAYEEALRNQRNSAATRQALTNANTADARDAARDQAAKLKAANQKKQDFAEYKEKMLNNLGAIKEMYMKAEDAFKSQRMKEAGELYSSVAMANVLGSEQMAETARGRLVELEDLAKTHLKSADDFDLKRDYVKEVDELALINREFPSTKTREIAVRRLVALKSKPDVAGYVELAQADALEGEGKVTEAVEAYQKVANNPRYENTIPSLKAKRKLDELNKTEATREKLKSEMDARAEKEAPVLLASAKNFAANRMPKMAIEKLQILIDKYPESKYAEEAKKLLQELK